MITTAGEIDFVRDLVWQHSGVLLGDTDLVAMQLAPLAQKSGGLGALVARLRAAPDEPLATSVVEALLNHETSFFRDHHPFALLRDEVFPALRASGRRPLRVWSAACASGQEAYSVALTLREHFAGVWPNAEILASDLSAPMLERARAGLYSQREINRGLPATCLVRHFDAEQPGWRIRRELRSRVEFRRINLVAEWPELPLMDVVLMRNVLIYFDAETRRRVLVSTRRALRPGGVLLLGATEHTYPLEDLFDSVRAGKTTYYRARGEGVPR